MVFSLGHLVIFGGKLENCAIYGQLPGKSLRLRQGKELSRNFFLNESLNDKLYEYEAIFEQLLLEKKLFDFKANFDYLFYAYFSISFFESSKIFCKGQRNGYHFIDLEELILNIYCLMIFNKN